MVISKFDSGSVGDEDQTATMGAENITRLSKGERTISFTTLLLLLFETIPGEPSAPHPAPDIKSNDRIS